MNTKLGIGLLLMLCCIAMHTSAFILVPILPPIDPYREPIASTATTESDTPVMPSTVTTDTPVITSTVTTERPVMTSTTTTIPRVLTTLEASNNSPTLKPVTATSAETQTVTSMTETSSLTAIMTTEFDTENDTSNATGNDIATQAEKYALLKSTRWSHKSAHKTGPNTNKCNIFVAEMIEKAGASVSHRHWPVLKWSPIGANEWAN